MGKHRVALLVMSMIALVNGAALATDGVPAARIVPSGSSGQLAEGARDAMPLYSVPAWASQARWYLLEVDRFRNGDAANDPPDRAGWVAELPVTEVVPAGARYGGDLAGVQAKFAYLDDLGVNTICLSPVFAGVMVESGVVADYRHVEVTYSTPEAVAVADETADAKTWVLTPADRAFAAFLQAAHERGFRVVVDVRFDLVSPGCWAWQAAQQEGHGSACASWFDGAVRKTEGAGVVPARVDDGYAVAWERYLFDSMERWLDPNGDGDHSDGVDGYRVMHADRLPRGFACRLYQRVKTTNANALLVGDFGRSEPQSWQAGLYDTHVNYTVGDALARLATSSTVVRGSGDGAAFEAFFDAVSHAGRGWPEEAALTAPLLLSSPERGRVLSRWAVPAEGSGPEAARAGVMMIPAELREADLDRCRLLMTLAHFCVGAPATWYGDEVGMMAVPAAAGRRPLWWEDLSDPASRSRDYRGDQYSLLRMLHEVRAVQPVLGQGGFRVAMLDADHRCAAVVRSDEGKELVLAINWSAQKQRVQVPAGVPGMMVGLLTPQLDISTTRRPAEQSARVSASVNKPRYMHGKARQVVDSDGKVTLVVPAMGMRIIMAFEGETGQWPRKG